MIVGIEDLTIPEIMQICVKEEIEFLTRDLLRQPPARRLLWLYLKSKIKEAAGEAGLPSDVMDPVVTALSSVGPPSGGGGGSDPGDDGSGRSGGGSTRLSIEEPTVAGSKSNPKGESGKPPLESELPKKGS